MGLSKEHEMLEFVHNTNIELFTERLANTTEQVEKDRLRGLLAAEKEKLRALRPQRNCSD